MKMHSKLLFLAACLLQDLYASPIGDPALQAPLEDLESSHQASSSPQLHGRFLHITDLHPDPFYKIHSSTEEEDACHRGKGLAGTYGAETSDCDTPYSLINATFKWIAENVRDVDFVVWTGDSARHDSDEELPRTADEVLSANRWIAGKFQEAFGNHEDPNKALAVPIVSTFGNNDILPHNILLSGPNRWLKTYTDIWRNFIPEEQRHGFERGGWYYVEVIPGKLAVFSLNTLYFFKNNAAVDGCALHSEPGYEHMEWLRIQLQFMRDRGMKAILTGHVPPARTNSKQLWDETCWQKYTLWLQQYRDVIVGGLYGHMNIDHFMLQDNNQVSLLSEDDVSADSAMRATMDEELSIESANDYLEELRENWSELPNPSAAIKEAKDDNTEESKKKKGKKDKKKAKKDKALKKIGGPWGERYSLTLVSPSLVPNFFPTLRVVEYNITGLDTKATWASAQSTVHSEKINWLDEESTLDSDKHLFSQNDDDASAEKKKGKKDKKKKPKKPDFVVPLPPSKSSPPGPAYSPQTLTLLGYTQYFANLTHINNDEAIAPEMLDAEDEIDTDKWQPGKHKGKNPKHKPHPKPFEFQVEYDTFTDPIYKLKDLTMRSYLKLAHRIGQYKPQDGDSIEDIEDETLEDISDDSDNDSDDEVEMDKKKEKHNKKKHHKQHEKNKVWLRFVRRAFVGTLDEKDLRTFDDGEVLIPEFREEL